MASADFFDDDDWDDIDPAELDRAMKEVEDQFARAKPPATQKPFVNNFSSIGKPAPPVSEERRFASGATTSVHFRVQPLTRPSPLKSAAVHTVTSYVRKPSPKPGPVSPSHAPAAPASTRLPAPPVAITKNPVVAPPAKAFPVVLPPKLPSVTAPVAAHTPLPPPVVSKPVSAPAPAPGPLPPPAISKPPPLPLAQQSYLQLDTGSSPPSSMPSQAPSWATAKPPPPGGNRVLPVQLSVSSRTHFTVGVANSRELWDFYSSIPGAQYDTTSRYWSFPAQRYQEVLLGLTKFPSVKATPLPELAKRIFLSQLTPQLAEKPISLDRVPAELLSILLPFQREGLLFAIRKNGRCLIGDEMGLGKTLQAIAVATYYKDDWPILAIVPSSVKLQWAEQLERWVPGLRGDDINLIVNGKGNFNGKVSIISFDLVTRMYDKIKEKRFNFVICDESHFIKNYKAKRTQCVIPIIQQARRALLLTGTPALSRPVELWTQISAIDKSLFPSGMRREFEVRYCAGHQGRFAWDATGNSNLSELSVLLSETIMIRRLKQDVLTELPPKRRTQVLVPIENKARQAMQKIVSDMKQQSKMLRTSRSGDIVHRAEFEHHRLLMDLYKATGQAKLPGVLEYIKDLIESDTKFLVFAHHQDILDGIDALLTGEKIDHIRIDGHTPSHHRGELAFRFQNTESCRVALLSITAAGVGLTLHRASTVVFTELFWNPGALLQAEDRAHRIGTVAESVNIYYLVAKDTVDERLWDMIGKKLSVVGEALNGQEDELAVHENDAISQTTLNNTTHHPVIREILESIETWEERTQFRRERMAEKVARERAESDRRRMVDAGLGDLLAVEEEEKRAGVALDPIEVDMPVPMPPVASRLSAKRPLETEPEPAPAPAAPRAKPAAASGMALLAKFRLKGKATQAAPVADPVPEGSAAVEGAEEPVQEQVENAPEEAEASAPVIVKKRPKFIAEDDD